MDGADDMVAVLDAGTSERMAWASTRLGVGFLPKEGWHPYRNKTHVQVMRWEVARMADWFITDQVEHALIRFLGVWHCDPEQSRAELADSAVAWVRRRTTLATPDLLDAIHRALVHVKCRGDGVGGYDLRDARDEAEKRRWAILADVELASRMQGPLGARSLAAVVERLEPERREWTRSFAPRKFVVDLRDLAPDHEAFVAELRREVERLHRGFTMKVSEQWWGEDRARTLAALRERLALHEAGATYQDLLHGGDRRWNAPWWDEEPIGHR
jgi:hypothetical protein